MGGHLEGEDPTGDGGLGGGAGPVWTLDYANDPYADAMGRPKGGFLEGDERDPWRNTASRSPRKPKAPEHASDEPPIGDRWQGLREEWKNLEASELDKRLPRDPEYFAMHFGADSDCPADIQAKLLAVVLLRGGSYSMRELEGEHAANSFPLWINAFPLGGLSDAEVVERITYQKMAVDLALHGGPDLFQELSASDGGEHLPTHRRPATQLMHILLQDGGPKGTFDGQNEVQAWIEKLPPETAGRAMYHMYDAARSSNYGGSFTITGIGLEAGPVGFSLQGEFKDTHWAEATHNINDGAGAVFGKWTAEDKQKIAEGFKQANTSFEAVVLK